MSYSENDIRELTIDIIQAKISYNADGAIKFECADTVFVFDRGASAAEVVSDILRIAYTMAEEIQKDVESKVLDFITRNKTNFH